MSKFGNSLYKKKDKSRIFSLNLQQTQHTNLDSEGVSGGNRRASYWEAQGVALKLLVGWYVCLQDIEEKNDLNFLLFLSCSNICWVINLVLHIKRSLFLLKIMKLWRETNETNGKWAHFSAIAELGTHLKNSTWMSSSATNSYWYAQFHTQLAPFAPKITK